MKPATGCGCTPEQREAISKVHTYEEPQTVPAPEVECVACEELAEHSPDGRPADRPSRYRGRMALLGVLLVGLPAVIFGVWRFGGTDALLMGLVYVGLLMGTAYPVWYAGMMRQREESEANEIVRTTLSAERFGVQPPQRRPR